MEELYNLNTPVDLLHLSPRTLNALIKNDICYIHQLIKPELTEELINDKISDYIIQDRDISNKLYSFKGVGRRAIREIKESIIGKKIFICEKNNDILGRKYNNGNYILTGTEKEYEINNSISCLRLSTKAENAVTKNRIKNIKDLFIGEFTEYLSRNPNLKILYNGKYLSKNIYHLKSLGKKGINDITNALENSVIYFDGEETIETPLDFGKILLKFKTLIISLDERDKEIVEGRFAYTDPTKKKTLQELGDKWGISRERANQRLKEVTKKFDNFITQYRNNIYATSDGGQYFEIFNIIDYKEIVNENYIYYLLKDCVDGDLFYYKGDLLIIRDKDYSNLLRKLIENKINELELYDQLKYFERQGKEVSLITDYLHEKLGKDIFEEIDKQLNLTDDEIDNLIYEIFIKARRVFDSEYVSINFFLNQLAGKKHYKALEEYKGCLKYYRDDEIKKFFDRAVENKGLKRKKIDTLGMWIDSIYKPSPLKENTNTEGKTLTFKMLHLVYEIMDQFGTSSVSKTLFINFCTGKKEYEFKKKYQGSLKDLKSDEIEEKLADMKEMGLIKIENVKTRRTGYFITVPSIIITQEGEKYYKSHNI